eukprot:3436710-Amphidinium_carterae.1
MTTPAKGMIRRLANSSTSEFDSEITLLVITARPVIQLTGSVTITNFYTNTQQPMELPTTSEESNETGTRPEQQDDVHNIS